MLSEDTRALRESLSDFIVDGITMTGRQVEQLVFMLLHFENMARQMEQPSNPVTITEQHLLDGSVVILPIIARDNKPQARPHPFEVIDGGNNGGGSPGSSPGQARGGLNNDGGSGESSAGADGGFNNGGDAA